MMSEQDNISKLARLEASLEFIKEFLKEIRDDLKHMPSKEDYNKLEDRVEKLEKLQSSTTIKIGIAAGVAGVFGGLLLKMLIG